MNQTTTFPKVFTNLCESLFTLYEKKKKKVRAKWACILRDLLGLNYQFLEQQHSLQT